MSASGIIKPGSQALIDRTGLAATDGAQVASSPLAIFGGEAFVFELDVDTTGAPTTFDLRASVEVSVDGTNWHQIVRFADHTNASAHAQQVARITAAGAGSLADLAAAALGSASAAGAKSDGVLAGFVRLTTKVQSLSGGTSPTVSFTLRAAVA